MDEGASYIQSPRNYVSMMIIFMCACVFELLYRTCVHCTACVVNCFAIFGQRFIFFSFFTWRFFYSSCMCVCACFTGKSYAADAKYLFIDSFVALERFSSV